MAQRTIVELVDDLDGGKADTTVRFAVQGVHYELDLSTEHAEEFDTVMAPWVDAARRTGGRRTTTATSSTKRSGNNSERLNKIRQWGRANGWKVSDRGRVAAELQQAYEAANPGA